MSIVLNRDDKSLEIDLVGAVSANQLPVTTHYTDYRRSDTVQKGTDTQTNDTTAVTIVPAPGVNTRRVIHSIYVFNADTASATITVQLNNNSTLRTLIKATIASGDQLIYESGSGWNTIDSVGGQKSTSGAPVGEQYVTLASSTTLTAERVLTGTANQITVTDGGAGGNATLSTPQDINTTSTPSFATLTLNQSNASGAIPAESITQADVDEPFTKYIGTAAAATLTNSIVAAGDVSTATVAGYIKIEVQDDGNQITDQDYYLAIYTLA